MNWSLKHASSLIINFSAVSVVELGTSGERLFVDILETRSVGMLINQRHLKTARRVFLVSA